ncbi:MULTISPECIES: molybdate ABC transporter substrate-binding protein [Actinomadura]|uniref:Molybdate ABC transporter substrate-binding protein n=1 Tax=Actinomadura geliboluensis TaxID=882440 RepID=A0A5S4HKD6_9ACTN|nr:molybdate ABC transporter substrate-binding protein [Actinomadura geliboluensis]TMR42020.1 molybdate ABC transporter substrate-binding protein [Actinomadura geliboluensis]
MPHSPRRRRLRASVLLAALAVPALGAGCGGPSGPVTLTVLATSALTEVFGEMGAAYHQEHPGVKLRFVFGGSPEIVDRLSDHAPADALVTADRAALEEAADHLAGRPRIVTHDTLTIAVGPGNPKRIRGLSDLRRPGLRVVVGAGSVPVGRYTRQALAKSALTVHWNSEEIGSRAVLDQVRSGEADAGIVYITDLRSAGVAASSVAIPAEQNVIAAFPAAPLLDSEHPEEAAAFVTWLLKPTAQKLFHKYGFPNPVSPR